MNSETAMPFAPCFGSPRTVGEDEPTPERPVRIQAEDRTSWVAAEHDWITRRCGVRDRDWWLHRERLLTRDGGPVIEVTVSLKVGGRKKFYFDGSILHDPGRSRRDDVCLSG